MNGWSKRILALALLTGGAQALWAQDATQVACDGPSNRAKAVTRPGFHVAQVDFSQSGGQLDPSPLIATSVVTGGGTRVSCLVAHFSAMAAPNDNHVVFQARVDGVPMLGHLDGFIGFATPVVTEPEETNLNQQRMVAYNFFARVPAGSHRVEVLFAGCCTSNPSAHSGVVGSPVLTLEYVQ